MACVIAFLFFVILPGSCTLCAQLIIIDLIAPAWEECPPADGTDAESIRRCLSRIAEQIIQHSLQFAVAGSGIGCSLRFPTKAAAPIRSRCGRAPTNFTFYLRHAQHLHGNDHNL